MNTTLLRIGLAALLLPTALFGLLLMMPAHDPVLIQPTFHFWIVGGVSLLAALACIGIIASGPVLRETRLLFLALAFLSIAGVFSVHGLMTPGHLVTTFHSSLPASAWLSVLAGATFVAFSAMEMPPAVDRLIRRAGTAIFAWVAIAVGIYVALSFSTRDWLDFVPTDERRIQYIVALASFALFAFATVRYAEAYVFARLPSQAAMVGALVLLTQVPAIILFGEVWHASWWIYHALYLAAFIVLFAGWAVEVKRAGSLKAIADALSMRDALAQLNRGNDEHVLALVDAIEAKDVATLGHVQRVSKHALAVGKALGLSANELRQLVLAAELHDVGKIGVPDMILAKPDPLDEAETAIMRRHTTRGHEIALHVGALRELAPVIRAHHERIGGSGYPDGLRGEEIPLLARIIAVADTYDAMTSHRPYRDAMTHEAAVAELTRVRAVELDARCVDALLNSFGDRTLAAAA